MHAETILNNKAYANLGSSFKFRKWYFVFVTIVQIFSNIFIGKKQVLDVKLWNEILGTD